MNTLTDYTRGTGGMSTTAHLFYLQYYNVHFSSAP